MSVRVENRSVSQCEALYECFMIRQQINDLVRKNFGLLSDFLKLKIEPEMPKEVDREERVFIRTRAMSTLEPIEKALKDSGLVYSDSVKIEGPLEGNTYKIEFKLLRKHELSDQAKFFWDTTTVDNIKEAVLNLAREMTSYAYSAHEYEKRMQKSKVGFRKRFNLQCKSIESADSLQMEISHISLISKSLNEKMANIARDLGKTRIMLRKWRNKTLSESESIFGKDFADSLGEQEETDVTDDEILIPYIKVR